MEWVEGEPGWTKRNYDPVYDMHAFSLYERKVRIAFCVLVGT